MIDTSAAFDNNSLEYDQWFEKHSHVYQSELLAVGQAVPKSGKGIEIGTGTGRFSEPFGIKYGVEPSEKMARVAETRGITVFRAMAENLPLANESYDFVVMVTAVCFFSDIPKAFSEVFRILKPGGAIIIGLIDKNSALGKKYEKEKSSNKFYRDAHFHSTEELTVLLNDAGFKEFDFWQTLLKVQEDTVEETLHGYGTGSFVVIRATKP